jgi:hypothetical protein
MSQTLYPQYFNLPLLLSYTDARRCIQPFAIRSTAKPSPKLMAGII